MPLKGSSTKTIESPLAVLDNSVCFPFSRKALACTGARVDDVVALESGGIVGRAEAVDLAEEPAKVDLEPLEVCVWLSAVELNDRVVGDCMREDEFESSTGDEAIIPVSWAIPLVGLLIVGVVAFGLPRDALSCAFISPLIEVVGDLSFPAPTAPRKRLYRLLSPFCMSSPAKPFDSGPAEPVGGEVNSLKVVSVSEWEAALWILSSAFASCSLFIPDDPARETKELRLDRKPKDNVASLGT